MNAKTAFKNTFKLVPSERPVFIPFVYSLAAKIEQIPLREIYSDAGYYVHALEEAYSLFNYDGIVNHYDSVLEAEAFGCEVTWPGEYQAPSISNRDKVAWRDADPRNSNRIKILLEATKRIGITWGKKVPVIGVMTGPCSLLNVIMGDEEGRQQIDAQEAISLVESFLTKMTRQMCELRLDALFYREDQLDAQFYKEIERHSKAYAAVYATQFNLTRHYNAFPALVVADADIKTVEEVCDLLRPAALIFSGANMAMDALLALKRLSRTQKVSIGLPLPMGDETALWRHLDLYESLIHEEGSEGLFYVSDGEVPYNMPLEIFHDLMTKIRSN